DETPRRHAARYVALGERLAEDARGRDELRALDRLEAERPNFAAAHAWALVHDRPLAARIALALEPLLLHRGPARDLDAMLGAALGPDLPDALRSKVLRARGVARRVLGDMRAACTYLEAAREAAAGSPREEAEVLAPLGDVLRSLGRHEAASACLEEALARA